MDQEIVEGRRDLARKPDARLVLEIHQGKRGLVGQFTVSWHCQHELAVEHPAAGKTRILAVAPRNKATVQTAIGDLVELLGRQRRLKHHTHVRVACFERMQRTQDAGMPTVVRRHADTQSTQLTISDAQDALASHL